MSYPNDNIPDAPWIGDDDYNKHNSLSQWDKEYESQDDDHDWQEFLKWCEEEDEDNE